MPLTVSLHGLDPVIDRLNLLIAHGEDLTVPLDQIGEREAVKTRDRFKLSVAPDGTAWEQLSRPRAGRIAGNEKPLRDTDKLMESITHRLYGHFAVGIGVGISDVAEYGKYHQFGWGVTPRPFLGVAQDTKNDIMGILHAHFIFI